MLAVRVRAIYAALATEALKMVFSIPPDATDEEREARVAEFTRYLDSIYDPAALIEKEPNPASPGVP